MRFITVMLQNYDDIVTARESLQVSGLLLIGRKDLVFLFEEFSV